jgi:hypothetical protein
VAVWPGSIFLEGRAASNYQPLALSPPVEPIHLCFKERETEGRRRVAAAGSPAIISKLHSLHLHPTCRASELSQVSRAFVLVLDLRLGLVARAYPRFNRTCISRRACLFRRWCCHLETFSYRFPFHPLCLGDPTIGKQTLAVRSARLGAFGSEFIEA